MAINDLRTKITDLPLCEDINSLDTMIGIGKDGKAYRIDSSNIGSGGKYEPIKLTKVQSTPMSINSSTTIQGQMNFQEISIAPNEGGKIHLFVSCTDVPGVIDLEFILHNYYCNSYNLGNNIASSAKLLITMQSNVVALASVILNDGSFAVSIDYLGNEPTNMNIKLVAAFFEPIKNIGDTSKTEQGGEK